MGASVGPASWAAINRSASSPIATTVSGPSPSARNSTVRPVHNATEITMPMMTATIAPGVPSQPSVVTIAHAATPTQSAAEQDAEDTPDDGHARLLKKSL